MKRLEDFSGSNILILVTLIGCLFPPYIHLLGRVVSQTESHFYPHSRTTSYDQLLHNQFDLELLNKPKWTQESPAKECVYSDSPVSCRQNYGRENCKASLHERHADRQSREVGTWWMTLVFLISSNESVK